MSNDQTEASADRHNYDYDWIVVGSGFGGSVAALRLAEKGYRVGVIECGRRFEDDDFAERTAQARRYYWMPKLGLRGILRMTVFKDVFIVSGCGVGGGSLGFANTLYRARDAFFADRQWLGMREWKDEIWPHYATAERMLGVGEHPLQTPADRLLGEYAAEIGVSATHKKARVGVCFGDATTSPGDRVGDPYFGGEGPERRACLRCGSCMIGCRHGAKNTLRKNYLWFAERLGVEILDERNVSSIRPLSPDDGGSEGYEVESDRSGAVLRHSRRTLRARGVVIAAGALGTNLLLQNCKRSGALPRLSDRLGELVRTNSESIVAVTAPNDDLDLVSQSIAITSSIYPDPDTHIEVVSYGKGGNSMSLLYTLMTGEGGKLTRPVLWVRQVVRHPIKFARTLWPRKWSERTIILLVMQTLDNAIKLVAKPKPSGGVRLQTEQDPERPNPTYIPAATAAARWFEKRMGGVAQAGITEALFDIPTTAHILGGAVIGRSPQEGVIDADHRVFGYTNLLVCDGAAIPANPGVNPSLTITAMAERAISRVENAPGAKLADLPASARPHREVSSADRPTSLTPAAP